MWSDGRTDGLTDITKLIVTFHISANALKNTTYLTMRKNVLTSSAVRGNVFRSRTAINLPLTGRSRRGRGRCVDW
jgi:hypothetical protein